MVRGHRGGPGGTEALYLCPPCRKEAGYGGNDYTLDPETMREINRRSEPVKPMVDFQGLHDKQEQNWKDQERERLETERMAKITRNSSDEYVYQKSSGSKITTFGVIGVGLVLAIIFLLFGAL
jgi:hypothetical protein